MNTTLEVALDLGRKVVRAALSYRDRDVMIAPPFPYLIPVREEIKDSPVYLGAQNMYHQRQGAFTGEVSPLMLRDIGCRYVILGHSERRSLFKEGDSFINKKVLAALEEGIIPILCVGETLEEREKGATLEVVAGQLRKGLEGLAERPGNPQFLVAYEPVWAIGTGRNASPSQAQEVHAWIRKELAQLFGWEFSRGVRIIYGGSVTPENIDGLMAEEDIDGALVGGASLDGEKFFRIIGFKNLRDGI